MDTKKKERDDEDEAQITDDEREDFQLDEDDASPSDRRLDPLRKA
jgi:hypothetical protein